MQRMEPRQFATIIVRSIGFFLMICGAGLLFVRGINAIGRLPWSYIGSFIREALVAPIVFIFLGAIVFGCAKKIGGWLGRV